MAFKTLVKAIIQNLNDPDECTNLNLIHSLKKEIRTDLQEAYTYSEPLVKQYKYMYTTSTSFLDFLVKLTNAARPPDISVLQNTCTPQETQNVCKLKHAFDCVDRDEANKITTLTEKVSDLNEQINTLKSNITDLNSNNTDLKKQLEQKEERLKECLAKIREKGSTSEDKLEQCQKDLLKAQKDLEKCEENLRICKREAHEHESKKLKYENEATLKTQQLKDSHKQINDLQTEHSQLQKKFDQIKNDHENTKEKLTDVKLENNLLQSRMDTNPQSDNVRSVLQEFVFKMQSKSIDEFRKEIEYKTLTDKVLHLEESLKQSTDSSRLMDEIRHSQQPNQMLMKILELLYSLNRDQLATIQHAGLNLQYLQATQAQLPSTSSPQYLLGPQQNLAINAPMPLQLPSTLPQHLPLALPSTSSQQLDMAIPSTSSQQLPIAIPSTSSQQRVILPFAPSEGTTLATFSQNTSQALLPVEDKSLVELHSYYENTLKTETDAAVEGNWVKDMTRLWERDRGVINRINNEIGKIRFLFTEAANRFQEPRFDMAINTYNMSDKFAILFNYIAMIQKELQKVTDYNIANPCELIDRISENWKNNSRRSIEFKVLEEDKSSLSEQIRKVLQIVGGEDQNDVYNLVNNKIQFLSNKSYKYEILNMRIQDILEYIGSKDKDPEQVFEQVQYHIEKLNNIVTQARRLLKQIGQDENQETRLYPYVSEYIDNLKKEKEENNILRKQVLRSMSMMGVESKSLNDFQDLFDRHWQDYVKKKQIINVKNLAEENTCDTCRGIIEQSCDLLKVPMSKVPRTPDVLVSTLKSEIQVSEKHCQVLKSILMIFNKQDLPLEQTYSVVNEYVEFINNNVQSIRKLIGKPHDSTNPFPDIINFITDKSSTKKRKRTDDLAIPEDIDSEITTTKNLSALLLAMMDEYFSLYRLYVNKTEKPAKNIVKAINNKLSMLSSIIKDMRGDVYMNILTLYIEKDLATLSRRTAKVHDMKLKPIPKLTDFLKDVIDDIKSEIEIKEGKKSKSQKSARKIEPEDASMEQIQSSPQTVQHLQATHLPPQTAVQHTEIEVQSESHEIMTEQEEEHLS